jgi:hypothetical protein
LAEAKEPSAADIMREHREVVAKEKEQKVSRFVRRLQQVANERTGESLWKRSLKLVPKHPVVFLLIIAVPAFAFIAVRLRPRRRDMAMSKVGAEMHDFFEELMHPGHSHHAGEGHAKQPTKEKGGQGEEWSEL